MIVGRVTATFVFKDFFSRGITFVIFEILCSIVLNRNRKQASYSQRYTYRVLQTIQMKLILSCVWAERAVLGSAKAALKFKYEIQIG